MALVDLSLEIEDGMPVYPGDNETRIYPLTEPSIMQAGWTAHSISMSLHAGTHIEAPAHSIPGGRMLSDYPLERFRDAATAIEWEEVGRCEVHTPILFIRAGYDRWWGHERYFSPPPLTKEQAEWIARQGVKIAGFDIISVGDIQIHRALQERDILIVEMMRGLEAVLHRKLQAYLFPLRIKDKEASPVRAVVEIAS